MPGPRPLVQPPTFVAGQYGLLSVVQPRYDEPDSHWRNGVTYQGTCDLGATTFDDYCVTGVGAPTKTSNIDVSTRGATPFTVYAEIDCSATGYSPEEQFDRTMAAFLRSEAYQVEYAFWTGRVANASGGYTAYPHLTHATTIWDDPGSLTSVLLQSAVDQVTGVALDPAEALGRLEGALGDCLAGQGVIHMSPEVAESMAARGLISASGGRMQTVKGNLVAIGDGYPGTTPTGSTTTGVHWMYATGQVFAYRSSPEAVGNSFTQVFNRDDDTVVTRVERTYVLGYDCCLLGIPVSLGGNVAGTFNAAT